MKRLVDLGERDCRYQVQTEGRAPCSTPAIATVESATLRPAARRPVSLIPESTRLSPQIDTKRGEMEIKDLPHLRPVLMRQMSLHA